MTFVWPTPIKAVIFDNDGTLLDTEWAYTWVHKEITGHELDWELKPQLMGKNAIADFLFRITDSTSLQKHLLKRGQRH